MSRKITIQKGETFRMVFPKACFPNWKEGDLLNNQVISSTGTTYNLEGTGQILSISQEEKGRFFVTVAPYTPS